MNNMESMGLKKHIELFFEEDDLNRNFYYSSKLPSDVVKCNLKFKEDCLIAGLPIFFEVFNYLLPERHDFSKQIAFESKKNIKEISFVLPFNVALTGERIALNLLQRATSIATLTNKFVEIASAHNIKILDTRKTTPGLRFLEKYAVVIGGGFNHRFGQNDMWMIKDNHKSFFGDVKKSVNFFKSIHSNYTEILAEIHDLDELKSAIDYDLRYFMLDNFNIEDIKKAMAYKTSNIHFEVSGNVCLENLKTYLIEGVDAISVGSLTSNVPRIDLSMKIERY